MGVRDHVREMKHTERTLVFPSPPVQKLSGECFSSTISGIVWVNDWLKVKVCLEYHPNDPRVHCAQSLQSFSRRFLKWGVVSVYLRVLYFNRKFFVEHY